MSKIDVSQWKEFKIDELFDKCILHKRKKIRREFDLSVRKTLEFDLPVVNAKHDNNGIMYYGRRSDFEITNKVIDIVQDGASSVGDVYPQFDDVSVLFNAYLIKLKNHVPTENQLVYLSTVLQRAIKLYFSYDNKCTWDKLKRLFIKLPVDSLGNPDWQYMDSYIAKRAALAHRYVSELESTKNQRKPLKILGWREYNIGQLFNIRPSKYIRGNGTAFSNRKLFDDGPNPVVVNSSVNNGIGGTTSYEPTEHGNVITYSDTVDGNTIFYQAKPFVGYSHVKVMEPKEKIDPAEMVFLTAVIGRRLSDGNYDYTNKMTTNRVLNTTIKLPALSDGTPDWATMRKRVADLAALSHRDVTSLDPAELPIFMGNWYEFKIGQLFDIETGGDLVFRNLLEGEIPVVSHSMENNGVKGYYQRIEGRKRYDHEITLALADRGTFFASSQAKDFYVATRVKALIFKDRKYINENIRLFLCSVINRLALRFADYSENATNRLPRSVIKLPVDINGHPDWQYMNDYVEFRKSIADRHVDYFQSIINK